MSSDDRALDDALAALTGTAATEADEDARWARRVASRITTAAPMSRRELDPIIAAPFPDGFQDEDFDHHAATGDDHTNHAAVAADVGGSHGWEGLMSEEPRPPSSLTGLAGLTRSGPTSSSSMDGQAKGDDSGLIDLRALSEGPPPVEEGAATIADLSKTQPAVPSSLSASKVPVASIASANAPALGAAAAPSAPVAAAPAQKKKGGAGLWIGLGGLAAAAAIALVAIPMVSKKDEAPTASKQADPGEDKSKKADEKVAATEKPAPAGSASPEPAASAAPTPEPGHTVAMAPTAKAAAGGAGAPAGKKEAPIVDSKPGAKPATTTAPTIDPINKPSGGSLDDVLGIGKDQPTAKKVDPNENLPDKPDSLDVRSAINAKVGAASGCVKGLDAASGVSVTFGPSGSVSGVAVTSGPAKGTGAESCIKSAFSSAKVPPSKKGATGSATLQP